VAEDFNTIPIVVAITQIAVEEMVDLDRVLPLVKIGTVATLITHKVSTLLSAVL
jgi:hypothetical protein